MTKFTYPESFSECPYCGEQNKPCSDITSLARAYARAACRKKHDGVTIKDLSIPMSEDLEFDL
jgi:hypothetical protein